MIGACLLSSFAHIFHFFLSLIYLELHRTSISHIHTKRNKQFIKLPLSSLIPRVVNLAIQGQIYKAVRFYDHSCCLLLVWCSNAHMMSDTSRTTLNLSHKLEHLLVTLKFGRTLFILTFGRARGLFPRVSLSFSTNKALTEFVQNFVYAIMPP